MDEKLLNDIAGAIITTDPGPQLIADVREERERIRAEMVALEAIACTSRLKRDELAFLAERLDAALPKLGEALERTQATGSPPL